MGDARRLKKKYVGPGHPWQKDRITEEKTLLKEYGLKNKTEIWKLNSKLKKFADIAKKLIAATGPQAEKEQAQLFTRLKRLGLVSESAKLDDVLSLGIKDILERRLQTVLCRKGMARTMKQSRQFITHNHIMINNKIMTVPGYIVPIEEEGNITFKMNSKLANPEHPERTVIVKEIKEKTDKKGNKRKGKRSARKPRQDKYKKQSKGKK